MVLGLAGGGLTGDESTATVAAFAGQTGVTFPLLVGDTTFAAYGEAGGSISPYPIDVIVDREGVVRYIGREFDGPAMQATVEQLLRE